MDDSFDPYAELQLSPDAEPELVKAAFKALAKKYHPDRFTDPSKKKQAEARMARINEAQQLIQSGKYRTPRHPESSVQKSAASAQAQKNHRPAAEPTPFKPPVVVKPIPKTPFLIAALFFLALIILPGVFSRNHLSKALDLEAQGQYKKALEQLNEAVVQAPQNLELYRHRARLWEELGEPERAAVDLKNAEIPGASQGEFRSDQVPNVPVKKSASDVP